MNISWFKPFSEMKFPFLSTPLSILMFNNSQQRAHCNIGMLGLAIGLFCSVVILLYHYHSD